ncbi:MAG: alpha/beta fold hydrolase [Steroidobacteraceae bacterium]
MSRLRIPALLRAAFLRGPALLCGLALLGGCTLLGTGAASAASVPDYGPDLQGFLYPYPVELYGFRTQAQSYYMAYMDVGPDRIGIGTGRTAVLLHGRRFCGATWSQTIAALHDAGFRVIVPDQLGFCKSAKPVNYQYSFEQLATNTHALLAHIQAGGIVLVGHDLGGMLAVRYALMFPQEVRQLVLVDPIGLDDERVAGVPYRTIDERYALELAARTDSIKATERQFYYAGRWRPQYDVWVKMLASLHAGGGRERFAWNQALVSDMIYTQPVVHELDRLAMPTLLIVGALDRATPFRDAVPPDVAARLGDDAELARRAAQHIPHARLIELPGVGHVPQIEAPGRFNQALLQALANPGARPPR